MSDDKFRVLAIDDSKDILELIQITLAPQFEVLTLQQSVDAHDIIEYFEPDLVLLDVMMPKVTGYQVLEDIKKNPKLNHVMAIFLSAKDTSLDIKYGYKLGANLYLTKPFQPERLLKNVQMLLQQSHPSGKPPHKTFSPRDVQLRMQLKMGQFVSSASAIDTPKDENEDPNITPHGGVRMRRRLGQEHDEIEGKKWRG